MRDGQCSCARTPPPLRDRGSAHGGVAPFLPGTRSRLRARDGARCTCSTRRVYCVAFARRPGGRASIRAPGDSPGNPAAVSPDRRSRGANGADRQITRPSVTRPHTLMLLTSEDDTAVARGFFKGSTFASTLLIGAALILFGVRAPANRRRRACLSTRRPTNERIRGAAPASPSQISRNRKDDQSASHQPRRLGKTDALPKLSRTPRWLKPTSTRKGADVLRARELSLQDASRAER